MHACRNETYRNENIQSLIICWVSTPPCLSSIPFPPSVPACPGKHKHIPPEQDLVLHGVFAYPCTGLADSQVTQTCFMEHSQQVGAQTRLLSRPKCWSGLHWPATLIPTSRLVQRPQCLSHHPSLLALITCCLSLEHTDTLTLSPQDFSPSTSSVTAFVLFHYLSFLKTKRISETPPSITAAEMLSKQIYMGA